MLLGLFLVKVDEMGNRPSKLGCFARVDIGSVPQPFDLYFNLPAKKAFCLPVSPVRIPGRLV